MTETLRAFVAIDPPETTIRALAAVQEAFRPHGLKIRWVRPTNIHLTLKFLGDVPADSVAAIVKAMACATGDGPPLNLAVDGLGVFPGLKRPRILWAGVHGDTDRLGALFRRLDGELARAGFPAEAKPFRAHMTLGRIRDRVDSRRLARAMAAVGQYGPVSLPARELVLVQSRLMPAGPAYTRLATAPLG